MSLRRRMQVLAAGTVFPVAALLVFDAYSTWRDLEATAERTVVAHARLIAGNVSTMLEGARQVAKAIVAYVESGPIDGELCGAYLRAIVRAEPRYFGAAVFAPDGRPWCRTAERSAPQISLADRSYFQTALRSTSLVVADVVEGRVARRPSLPLALSYRDDRGDVAGVVLLAINLEELAETMAGQFSSDRGFALVADRHGTIAVGVPDYQGTVTRTLPAAAMNAINATGPRAIEHLEFRGRPHIVGVTSLSERSMELVVMVGLDRELTLATAQATLIRSLGVAALATLLAIIVAWWVGRRLIETPVRRLVHAAQRRAAGDVGVHFPEGPSGTEFERLGGALNAMVAEIERLLQQKTLLIREVQHRVMNSLQLLGAFLHLQARQVNDPAVRRHLTEARERILSLSIIYRHLYHSEATNTVDFGETLRALCTEMSRTYLAADEAGIKVVTERLDIPTETALSLALVVHELVTNAIKHAYDSQGGTVIVELVRSGTGFRLAVTDHGRGLPPDFAMERPGSLGMIVIQTLVAQLRGTARAERLARGTRFTVLFPAEEARAAA